MKKHSLDLFLKKSKTIWKRNILKNTKLKVKILAGAATKKPPLNTVLTILGVNTETFVQNFNANTSKIFGIEEVLLRTIIVVTPAKTAVFTWNLPTIHDLFRKVFKNNNWDRKMSEDIQKKIVARATYILAGATTKKTIKQVLQDKMRQIYGTISSWDIYNLADHAKDKKRQKKKK